MNTEIFNLITFDSTHSAIRAEKELLNEGLKVKVIPVPTEITTSCGLSIRIALKDLEKAKKILKDNNIEVSGYYYVEKLGLKKYIIHI
ncbi:DUF3343 domain-containing protein [Clostridium sp.]|jgi:pyridoxine 5'-phosphate synthase PdxJ|uniref:DUF3343 domain-containing protein n=1 Tax=Clostridium sp. TaxID=1506 RepID=UPI002584B49F|nr:DUF3343 domain-containing protein [Clostridium sp.]MDF2505368.1 hypothetical protein [Clostridium sp.]